VLQLRKINLQKVKPMGQISLDYGESSGGFQTMNVKLSATALSNDASESSVIKDWLLANDQAPRHEELITLVANTKKVITMNAQAGGVIIEPVNPTTDLYMGNTDETTTTSAHADDNLMQISLTEPQMIIFDPATQPAIELFSAGGGTVKLLWI